MFTQVTIIAENDDTWWGTKRCDYMRNNEFLKTLLTKFDSKDKVANLFTESGSDDIVPYSRCNTCGLVPLCDSDSGVYVACAIATEEFDDSEYIYVFHENRWNFYRKSDASLIPFVSASNLEVE